MNKTEILNLLFKFQKGVFFTDKIVKDNYEFWYSDIIDDIYWNYTVVNGQIDFEKVVKETIEFYNSKNRKPSFYLIENQYPELEKYLGENGFKNNGGDVWMQYNGKPIDLEITLTPKLCETKEDLKISAELTDKSYFEGEIYEGASTKYGEAIINSFGTQNTEFYLFYLDNVPIGTGQISWDENSSNVACIGVPKEHRNKGYGKQISKFLIDKVKEKKPFIQTEKDTFVEKMYVKVGFDRVFCVNYWSKD